MILFKFIAEVKLFTLTKTEKFFGVNYLQPSISPEVVRPELGM